MKYGKRQLILASLVLALGAAVYLNWQFAGTGVQVEESSAETSSALGAAQLVNNNYVETVSDGVESTAGEVSEPDAEATQGEASEAAAPAAEKLSDARMTRQTARDEAVEMLEDILNDAEADSAVKEAAVSEASAIAQNILKETNIESLVAAKGFSECVAYINDNTCTIVVNGDMEDAQNALIVRDIAAAETGFSADQIKIISAAA
ncbi:MAG: SpoIIIAH-like family protein [Acutalibacteraceae bacterium]|nr:SpoIIIAH-like family protein [Acutalibacteraceae bacterium]